MKKALLLSAAIVFFSLNVQSQACVGRILNVAIVKSVNESLLAELVSVLINERTGTTVEIRVFDSTEDIYEAVKTGEAGIVIENTDNAMNILNMPVSGDKGKDYNISKTKFRERFNLIWLKPFGYLPEDNGGGRRYYAAVITEDILINFPALPRVINKLKNITDDRGFGRVIKSVRSDGKIREAARDLLKKKKLI